MSAVRRAYPQIYSMMTPATLDQANPVQNTWYTIADLGNAMVLAIAVSVAVANETLQVRITVDGVVFYEANDAWVAVAGTSYDMGFIPYATAPIRFAVTNNRDARYSQGMICEGRTVKVEVRKTSVNGAGNLSGIVVWETVQ